MTASASTSHADEPSGWHEFVEHWPILHGKSRRHLGMAGVLYGLIRRDLLRYQRLKFYLISYCAYRFVTEFIRPEPIWWLGLTFYQWVSITLAGGLAIQWVFDRHLARPQTDSIMSEVFWKTRHE